MICGKEIRAFLFFVPSLLIRFKIGEYNSILLFNTNNSNNNNNNKNPNRIHTITKNITSESETKRKSKYTMRINEPNGPDHHHLTKLYSFN